MGDGDQPLVVTALLDRETQHRFDEERQRLFPAGRTQVGAHVTLFHAVPGEHLDAVRSTLRAECALSSFAVRVTGLRSLGRGVAYELESPDLTAVHGRLAAAWKPWLTPQDRQRFRAHITVQNKVDPAAARTTLQALSAGFTAVMARCEGLQLWHYVGGPWQHEATFRFGVAPDAPG